MRFTGWFKLIYFLFLNNLRSFFGSSDLIYYLSGFSILIFVLIVILFPYIQNHPYVFLFFGLEIYRIHGKRKDSTFLLQVGTARFLVLILEYTLYSFPLLAMYIVSSQWIPSLILFAIIVLISISPKLKTGYLRYPFNLFVPFWRGMFRQYHFWGVYPFGLFLTYKGFAIDNLGLIMVAFVFFNALSLSIVFQRVPKFNIGSSGYLGEDFLQKEIQTTCFNYTIYFSPLLLMILYWDYSQLWLFLASLVMGFSAILIKYSFYDYSFQQSVVFLLFLIFSPFLISFLMLPYFYKRSVQQIKFFQRHHASN